MLRPIFWDAAAISDRGRIRANNEDCVLCDPLRQIYALADGMGGHASGEIASRLAIDTAYEYLRRHQATLTTDPAATLQAAIRAANTNVMARSKRHDLFAGMGTTLLLATLSATALDADGSGTTLHYAHVGDSRLYRFRAGRLQQLTHDHTLAQWWIDIGLYSENEARASSGAHRLTRAIGMDIEPGEDTGRCSVLPDDLFLLCSDGLTHELNDAEIAAACRKARDAHDSADTLCRRLLELANDAGGRDNISVLVLQNGAAAAG